MEGRPVPALEREQRRLEREIRSRTLHMRGDAPGDERRFDPARLLERLGETTAGGTRRARRAGAGAAVRAGAGTAVRGGAARRRGDRGRTCTGRAAAAGPPGGGGRLPVVEAAGRRLEELLLGPAARAPGLRPGRGGAAGPAAPRAVGAAAVAAGAGAQRVAVGEQLAARPGDRARRPAAGTSWCAGRDWRPAARRCPNSPTATADRPSWSTTTRACRGCWHELDGAALAHIAAHGTFRADSPLFSSLRMADGPLIVHDFERLDRSPYRIILSSCDTARLASVGADELLGLVTALLPLGTAGVVASSAPVNDAAVVPLMLALHKGLSAGLSLAEALRDARAALPGDAMHQATGWAFSAFGAA